GGGPGQRLGRPRRSAGAGGRGAGGRGEPGSAARLGRCPPHLPAAGGPGRGRAAPGARSPGASRRPRRRSGHSRPLPGSGGAGMSTRLEALFYPERPESAGRRLLLAPLALAEGAFLAGVALRTAAYARGWARRTGVGGLRIVSVGNLTVGGAGKTPVVRALAERLQAAGASVAILSRGYGRRGSAHLLVEGPRWPSVEDAGDEPLMLARG